jgi:prolyl-tRNA editing enzyme YbaK/EbsC (Cys-tRNA(Pro) deacylase)
MSKGVERFRQATADLSLDIRIHPQSTHTAQEAADAVGAPVGAIVKSLLFTALDEVILVLASGPNRVNQDALADRLGLVLGKADADTVKEKTGYSIGGVPPFGHPNPLRTVMDEDFFAFEQVWAAAGSPSAVFPVTPAQLERLSGATVMPIT